MSIETVLRFAQLGLSAPVLQAIDEIGYETPSPIQAQSIPPMIAGQDLLGQAQTGTGKTAAFALPILCRVNTQKNTTQALVLTPTRELAIQVAEAIHAYARHIDGLHVLPVYGGQHIVQQLRPLKRGVHVVVGTPGRIIDHLERGTLKIDTIDTVVLDEADEMLRMGFIEEVNSILERTPEHKQVALFSATMPSGVRRIADRHLKNPALITIETPTQTVDTVQQHYLVTPGRQKLDAMTRILETTDFDAMLVFVRTKVATLEVSEKLEARGYACSALNGDMTQPLRERTVQRLRDGSLDIVVATDVAARGLDVTRITHVVNYDIPIDTDSYVHRIGRTGRAGREGQAILLVQPREKRMLHAIERATGQLITPMQLPSVAAVTQRRVAMFKQAVLETIESQELGFFDEVLTDLAGEHEHSMEQIAAALVFMVQQDRPLQPAEPEIEVFDQRHRSDRRDRRDERGQRGEHPGKQHRNGARHDDRGRDRRVERSDFRDKKSDFANGRAPGPLDAPPAGSERYRLEVGHDHGAQPKHIAGAIINETGLDGRDVGRIKVHDGYSVVDLPEHMPGDVYRRLQRVEIFGHPLRVSKLSDRPRKSKDHRGRSGNGSTHGKPMNSAGSFKGKKHAKNGKHSGKPAHKAKGKHKKAKQRHG